jgi:hypothetical protein
MLSSDVDVTFISFGFFGKPEEIAKLGVGSQVASTGLVPGMEDRTVIIQSFDDPLQFEPYNIAADRNTSDLD